MIWMLVGYGLFAAALGVWTWAFWPRDGDVTG